MIATLTIGKLPCNGLNEIDRQKQGLAATAGGSESLSGEEKANQAQGYVKG